MDEEQTRQVVRDELKGLDPRVRRRTILKVAGAAGLAGVLGGSAAGQTTSDGAQLDVGGVTTNTYRIAGNLYGGVDADKSELTSELGSADTGAKYRASDTKSYYHWDGSSWTDITPGGGSGAPTDAQYVTLALNGTLSDERTLNATGSLTQTDNGANSNVDLDVSDDGITATEIASGAVGTTQLAADAATSTEIASGAVGSTQLATDAAGGSEINLSDIAGSNITVDATNDELDASASGSAVTAQEDDTDLTTDMALIDFKSGLTATNPTGDEVDVNVDESEFSLSASNVTGVSADSVSGAHHTKTTQAKAGTALSKSGDTLNVSGVTGTEINLSDIAGSNITVDATNDELDASASGSAVTAQEDDTDLTTDMSLIDFKGGLTGTNPTGDEVDVTTDESEIDHDSLQNYVANEHVDHSTVSISSGTGLTGGGDITASRTLGVAANGVTGTEIDLSDIAGQNITVDGTNDELDASASGAPTGASYVTISNDGTLTDERTINATGSLSQTDNGANNNLDLDVSDDGITATEIASGAVGSTQLATDAVGGTEINLSDIAGDNITVDGTNDELDASAGVSQVATGTVTATGGSQPAVDTTLANVSTTQTLDYWLTVHTESDPAFNADYAFNFDYYHQWDDSAGELDMQLIVNWDTDPGGGNDVTLRWEVLQ